MWLRVSVLLAASSQLVLAELALAQTPIEGALAATVIIETSGADGQGLGHGSGFVTSSDGIIVTAAHVIQGATSATVRFQNGDELDVEGVIQVDWAKDYAIVRVAGFDLQTVGLGNADEVSVGQRVIVIGAPMDPTLAGTVSDGLVAASRMWDGTRHIQISAPTSPGNSGGPVMTEEGEVIGLVVSGINAEGAENLNFALPINYVRGQLSLAATRPLQPLAEVQETIIAETAGSSTGRPTYSNPPTYGDVNLDERFLPDPYEVSLTAGGGIDVDIGECNYGYVAESPDVDFYYATSGDRPPIVVPPTVLVQPPPEAWGEGR